jgi:two-component system sensor histidine kinase KdpD
MINRLGISKESALMIFLVGVLMITVLTKGYIYGIIASIISVLIFNYFYAVPLHSIYASNPKDYILIFFFLLASAICATLSLQFKHQTELAKQNEETVRLLYEISKSFLNLSGVAAVVVNGMNLIHEYTGYECRVALKEEIFGFTENKFCSLNYPKEAKKTDELFSLPINDHTNPVGYVTITGVKQPIPQESQMLLKTVVHQMALALDRELISNERERIKLAMESEHLKSTLLRSISHDIRTPLTGIMGASSLILESYENIDEASMKRLVSDINEESARLIHSIQNILDMTRISEGRLTVKKEYEAVDDLFNQVLTQVSWLVKTNRLRVIFPDDIILVETDGRLIVQVLINLLDNAYKHSGNDSTIELKAYKEKNRVVFEVSDNGLGIDETIKDTLFDSFVTLPRNSSDSARGVGLGLSICKAIIDAHKGKITAGNKPEGGAVFRIELPYEEESE